jgi:drug/metabolite transporter (DMT)-like permease
MNWIIIACGASVLWGLVYALDKKVLGFMSVTELYCLYYTAGAMVFWAMLLVNSSPGALYEKTLAPERLPWIAATIGASILANYFIARSIQISNASLAALIEVSYPLFTILFSYLLLKETGLSRDVLIGAALIFSGVVYISLKT